MEYIYKTYKIKTEIEISTIYDFYITEKINHHTELFLMGSASEETADDRIQRIDRNSKIEIRDIENEIIFCGMIKNIKMSITRGIPELELNAISFSFSMDIKKQERIFQDLDLTYQDIIKEIMKPYPKGIFLDTISQNTKIPHILIQYKETDWEFIKRLVSHFQGILCVNARAEAPQFYFGFPNYYQNHEIESKNVKAEKDLLKYIKTARNYQRELQAGDEIVYTIETYEKLNICDEVIYKNKRLIVSEAKMMVKKEEMMFQYKFVSKKSAALNIMPNHSIQGVRLQAAIQEIQGNKARLQFAIEQKDTGKNKMFFPYSGEENNRLGYYMAVPESKVEVYFPDIQEKNAFISACIREENENLEYIPSEKYFRNESKKEMLLGKENLRFTAGNDKIQISLKRDGTIAIHSPKLIKIDAGRESNIGIADSKITKRISVCAENAIRFQVGQLGNTYIELNENANIICKAAQNILHKGKKEEKKKTEDIEKTISKQNIETLRRNIMAFSGVEFVSQAVHSAADFEQAKQRIGKIVQTADDISGKEETEYNPIRDELLGKNEKLFKRFSYGENLNGNET